jgi:gluconate kinase
MSQRIGEKRPRLTGRESDGFHPPKKQSRVDEGEPNDDEEDSAGDFTFTQMQAQTQDEQEAVERTKEMKNMVGLDFIRVWQTHTCTVAV